MQALYITDQSWHARRSDLQRMFKAMQIHINIMYEDCKEHIYGITKIFQGQFRNPGHNTD